MPVYDHTTTLVYIITLDTPLYGPPRDQHYDAGGRRLGLLQRQDAEKQTMKDHSTRPNDHATMSCTRINNAGVNETARARARRDVMAVCVQREMQRNRQ